MLISLAPTVAAKNQSDIRRVAVDAVVPGHPPFKVTPITKSPVVFAGAVADGLTLFAQIGSHVPEPPRVQSPSGVAAQSILEICTRPGSKSTSRARPSYACEPLDRSITSTTTTSSAAVTSMALF